MSLDQDKILSMVEQMPTFPASAHRIIELTNDINCAPKDLVEVIEHDPVLTLKVLKLINSSYFSLAQEVTSVKHSVVYLGINTIKNLALSVATIGALPSENKAGFDMGEFWMHSLLTAGISRQIAGEKSQDDVILSNSFVGGLLHDIGKIVFVQFMPEEFGQCIIAADQTGRPLYELEVERIGTDHAALGALVAKRWQLPERLCHVIHSHHDITEHSPTSTLNNCLWLGNELSHFAVSTIVNGVNVTSPQLPNPIQTWLGMTAGEYFNTLSKISDDIEKAKMFIELGKA